MDVDLLQKQIVDSVLSELSTKFRIAIIHHYEEMYELRKDIDLVTDASFEDLIKFFVNYSITNKLHLINVYSIELDVYRFDLCVNNNGVINLVQLDILNGDRNLMMYNPDKMLRHIDVCNIVNGVNIYSLSQSQELEAYIVKKAYKKQGLERLNEYKLYGCEELSLKYNQYLKYFNSNKFVILKIIYNSRLLLRRIFGSVSLVCSGLSLSDIKLLRDSKVFRYVYVVEEENSVKSYLYRKISYLVRPTLIIHNSEVNTLECLFKSAHDRNVKKYGNIK